MEQGANAEAAIPASLRKPVFAGAAFVFRRDVVWHAVAGLSAAAMFGLAHPYRGIAHDGLIYVGRALANADPAGLGRDILFAHDEQSRFSLYPRLLEALVAGWGASTASLIVTAAALAAWFLALAALARRLAAGRLLWAALMTAAILPVSYGGFAVFRVAEPFATPRPIAEALVLAGFAAVLTGRQALGFAAMVAAGLLHPIMAAPGLAVWLMLRWNWDRRRIVGAGATLAAVAVAWLSGAHRILAVVDADWAAALGANAYLFPARWPAESWANIAVQAATILMAAPHVPRSARSLLIAILAVGALGLATALAGTVFGPVLLLLQVQPWRALWPVAVVAPLLLPIAAVGAWRAGPNGRLAIAFLLLGWLPLGSPIIAGASAVLALVMAVPGGRPAFVRRPTVLAAWLALVILAAAAWSPRALFGLELLRSKPQGAALLSELSALWVLGVPVVAGCLAWVLSGRPGPRWVPAAVATATLVAASLMLWDDRPASTRRADERRPDPALVRLLPDGPGEILWLRGGAYRVWALAGRASWVSYLQGAGMVFSRPLSSVWQNRMSRLVAARLADESDREPWKGTPRTVLRPDERDIAAICAAPDAPAAIVAPLDNSIRLPVSLPRDSYVAPAPDYVIGERDGRMGWTRLDSYAVIACGIARP